MTKLTKFDIKYFAGSSDEELQRRWEMIGTQTWNRLKGGPRKGQLTVRALKRSDLIIAELLRRRAAREAAEESRLQDTYSEAELFVIRQRIDSIRDYSISMAVTDGLGRVDGLGKITDAIGDMYRRFTTRDMNHVANYELKTVWLNEHARKAGHRLVEEVRS